MAALTKYVLLHAVCTQLGHTTLYIQNGKIRYEGFVLQNYYFPHVMYCAEIKS